MPPNLQFFCALLLLLFSSRLLGEVAVRLHQPQLVGELIAGVGLGAFIGFRPDLLPHLVNVSETEAFAIIVELGAFFLMIMAGLELDPSELTKNSIASGVVATAGVVVPFAAGCFVGWFLLPDSDAKIAQIVLLGVTLAITDVPTSLWVLVSLGQLHTPPGRLIVSAAIFDDILGLILLALLTAIVSVGGTLVGGQVFVLLARIGMFFIFALATGHFFLPWLRVRLRGLKESEHEFSLLILVALGYGLVAEVLELHLILGAFFAGLFFVHKTDDSAVYEEVKSKMSGITSGFFAPLFFASVGLSLDLSALTSAPIFLIAIIVAALVSKIVGCGAAAILTGSTGRDALSIGIAMSARGAVALVVARIALDSGILDADGGEPGQADYVYSSIVLVAILTSILSPIALHGMMRRGPAQGNSGIE